MRLLRTPDERFADLADFPFEPRYAEVGDGIRVHRVDEGDPDAPCVLLLHGEPTWSYLYRRIIPPLVERGLRVVAPDLVGFGRSDKPADRADHTYARHVAWMSELVVDRLRLRRITLFGQDWGGLIGLRLVAAYPERFASIVLSNTGLPTGDLPVGPGFLVWQRFSQTTPEFPVGTIVNGGSARNLSTAEIAAYDAPFPDESYKAGPRVLPALVPTSVDDPAHRDNTLAWGVLERFERPVVCCFSDSDPVTRGGEKPFIERVPGARGRPHETIVGASHFVQEDAPERLVEIVATTVALGTDSGS